MITHNPVATTSDASTTIRDRVLEDVFRATLTLCRRGSTLARHDPVVEQVIVDLDHAMRLLRDAARLDALLVDEPR